MSIRTLLSAAALAVALVISAPQKSHADDSKEIIKVRAELRLTPEQEQKLRQIQERYAEQARKDREQYRDDRGQMIRVGRERNERMRAEINEVLNAEQREKFAAYRNARKEELKQRREARKAELRELDKEERKTRREEYKELDRAEKERMKAERKRLKAERKAAKKASRNDDESRQPEVQVSQQQRETAPTTVNDETKVRRKPER